MIGSRAVANRRMSDRKQEFSMSFYCSVLSLKKTIIFLKLQDEIISARKKNPQCIPYLINFTWYIPSL